MRVARQVGDDVVEYWARVHLEGAHVELEVLKRATGIKLKTPEFFFSTEAIPGYRDWFLISGHPVLLALYLHWTNNTQVLMRFARSAD